MGTILWLNCRMRQNPSSKRIQKNLSHILWRGGLFTIVLLVYILCPVTTSTDSRWTFYIAMSIIDEGNVNLDEYSHLMEERDFRVIYLDNHIYSYFPLGVPVASVPFVWLVDRIFELRYPVDFKTYLVENFPNQRLAQIEMIIASMISALTTVFFFNLVSIRLDRRRAFWLALLFALCTPMLSTSSRALWQHGLSTLCLTSVLWLLLQKTWDSRTWKFFLAGILLGLSYVIRPTNSVSILFITIFIFMNHRNGFMSYCIGVVLPIMALVSHSIEIYRGILPPYYLPQRLGENSDFLNAFPANLISPNRGLFTSTPIFLFSLFGYYWLYKSGRLSTKSIEPFLAGIVLFHWIAISLLDNWVGGESLGPRFFTDMTPYLSFLLIPILNDERLLSSQLWRIGFVAAIMLSGLVHFRYVTSIYPTIWNEKPTNIVHVPERAWDILDLQVLRGMCKDKLEGAAPHCWIISEEQQ